MKKLFCRFCMLVAAMAAVLCLKVDSFAEDGKVYDVSYDVIYHQTEARAQLKILNEYRTSDTWYWNEDNTTKTTVSGLNELKWDYTLEETAMQRAAEIALWFEHMRPDGSGIYTAFSTSTMGLACGENLLTGTYTIDSATALIMWEENDEFYSGQGHRRNMLNKNYTTVGIACVEIDGAYYWVQNFGGASSGKEKTTAVDSTKGVKAKVAGTNVAKTAFWVDGTKRTSADYSTVTIEEGKTQTISGKPLLALTNMYTYRMFSQLYGAESAVREFGIPLKNYSVTWTSSDTSIATVSGSTLTAVKAGETTITCNVCGKKTSVKVVVKAAATPSPTPTATPSPTPSPTPSKTPTPTPTSDPNGDDGNKAGDDGGQAAASIKNLKVKLSTKTYTYDGKAKKPSVSIEGLTKDKDFTVSYSSNKAIGTAKVTIKGIGDYTGTQTVTFTIRPKSTKLVKLSSSKSTITVKWNKGDSKISGYEVQYSTAKNFKSYKSVKVSKRTTTSTKLKKGLKSGKYYYVRVRTYKTVNGKKYYSGWSTVKKVKCK